MSHVGFRCVRTLPPGAQVSAFRPRLTLADAPALVSEPPPATSPRTWKVAAVIYSSGGFPRVDAGCRDDSCALVHLTADAARGGAKLVVLPEYALGAQRAEPSLGALINDPADVLAPFSRVARTHRVFVVVQLTTHDDSGEHHNSQVAFGPGGEVVAVHHKFELFEGERHTFSPGRGATTFETPIGRVGLLVCADMYGDPRVHEAMVAQGAVLVVVSSLWTANAAPSWPRHLAYNLGVAVVAANHAGVLAGGGGVFGPDGQILARSERGVPSIASAEIVVP